MKLSAAEKTAITATCQAFIDTVLKPQFLSVITPTPYNYPVDIQGKWHGSKYRFLQRYRSGFTENLGEEFDAPFVRIDWIGRDRFDIQWRWILTSSATPEVFKERLGGCFVAEAFSGC
jgi:hypothetical protein